MLLGVDVGGTFTDAVLFDGSALHAAKAPTTPDDQSRGVLAAVEAALERAGARADRIEVFAHGMTVGTNALLEQRGARTALVATEGFTDLLDVARQSRPELYRLCAPKPAPLVPDNLRVGARERIGPAGGVVGAALLATLSGDGNAVGLDMGGTSCDVCVVEEGRVRRTDSRRVEGRVIQLPMIDVHTVGAGGGSIGWRDPGGALRAGPRSAGADPGPACYGRGGTEPTVTDANLLLGYLDASSTLAGGVDLDVDSATAAVEGLGSQLGLETLETAERIVRVANQEMIRALRVVTVDRGIDPRDFALMPFGGAGPKPAAALAGEPG